MNKYVETSGRKTGRTPRHARHRFAVWSFCAAALAISLPISMLAGCMQSEWKKVHNTIKSDVSGVGALYDTQRPTGADGDLMTQLSAFVAEYPALAPVVETPAQYPESLIRLFLVNQEVLDTLLQYPEQKNRKQSAVTNKDIMNGFPALMQWDLRWAYQTYGDDMLAVTGCGPTCLSVVAIYLTGSLGFTPAAVAARAEAEGYYVPGTGTAWAMMSEGATGLGLASEEISLDESQIYGALREGRPIICSMRQGDFTTSGGHFIVLTSVDEEGNITIHDPARNSNNARTWQYNELDHQIKNLWVFAAA